MALAKKMATETRDKRQTGMRAFVEDHEDALWAVVLGLGLLLLSFYSG